MSRENPLPITEDDQAKTAEPQAKTAEPQSTITVLQTTNVELQAELAANRKKKEMKALKVNDNDLIHLNIRGQKQLTFRATLCQARDSYLAKMFSGRLEESLERDEDGAVILDFNPEYFGLILDYLRIRKIALEIGKPIPLPEVTDDQLEHFNNLVQQLGLSGIVPKENAPSSKLGQHSPGATV